MNTIVFWLLISISDGSFSNGSPVTIQSFDSAAHCMEFLNEVQAMRERQILKCIPVKGNVK